MASIPTKNCISCGVKGAGNYCSNCGAPTTVKRITLKALLHDVFHFFTHLDSKFIKTIRLVLFKPGMLALEYCEGVRKKYFKPVSLFLIGIIIYLLLPLKQGLNMSLSPYLTTTKAWHLNFAERLVDNKLSNKNISFSELAEKYEYRSVVFAKPMLFIILPLIGLALMLFFYRKQKYYFDHFILALEMSNFFLYVVFIILPVLLTGIAMLCWWIFGKNYVFDDYFSGPIVILTLVTNWSIAFKRFYKIKTWHAILKAIFFLLPFAIIVFFIYRILLFLITLISI
ncbi:MAG: DUF3667 domain-containing protein [Pedobacter sp.]|nr:MAG: DUF3667 domain-containing protein [Pedobacter sp.]